MDNPLAAQHSDAVVSIVASQQEGPVFESWLVKLISVWSLHAPLHVGFLWMLHFPLPSQHTIFSMITALDQSVDLEYILGCLLLLLDVLNAENQYKYWYQVPCTLLYDCL